MTPAHPLYPLVNQLRQLPGIGPRSAQRLAFFFLSKPLSFSQEFAGVLSKTRQEIRYCETCFNLSIESICDICSQPNRQSSRLCVVSDPKDIIAIERMGEFDGYYHVLGGLISPLDNQYPESLRINELLARLKNDDHINEIILAIDSSIEGDSTVAYLSDCINKTGQTITRLAQGLPMGAHIDYADDITLQTAFLGRVSVGMSSTTDKLE